MAEFDPATLNAEQCPAPDFTDLAAATKDALCNIDQRSLERDQALAAAHQNLVTKVELMDEGNVTDIINTINNFIKKVDADGDGDVDGLAELIKVNDDLEKRVATLEESAKLTEKKLVAVQEQQSTTQQTLERHSVDIADLKNREDKVGVTEDRVIQIASDAVCKGVLKPIQKAVADFAATLNAIDCGVEAHKAFMAAHGGESVVDTAESEAPAAAETSAVETGGVDPVDAAPAVETGGVDPVDDNPAADVLS